jgi:hypothetical protein
MIWSSKTRVLLLVNGGKMSNAAKKMYIDTNSD